MVTQLSSKILDSCFFDVGTKFFYLSQDTSIPVIYQ